MTSLTDTSLKWYNENQKVEWGRFHSILHPVQELLDHAWPLLVTVMYWLDIAIRMHFRDAKWCSCKNQEKGERDSNGEKLGGRFYPINIHSNKYTVQALGHATALPWCGKSLAFPCQNIFLPTTLPSLSLSVRLSEWQRTWPLVVVNLSLRCVTPKHWQESFQRWPRIDHHTWGIVCSLVFLLNVRGKCTEESVTQW